MNPQVHAFDNRTLVENLEGMEATVESARLIGENHPIAIGPITLRPRFNPNATGTEPETPAGELPARVDPRQMSLFGAGWTLGTLKALSRTGVYSLTYYETTGRLGVMEREKDPPLHPAFPSMPGWAFPLYHVLADVGEFAGLQFRDVLGFRPRKGMVNSVPFVFRGVECHQWKVGDPQEIELLRIRGQLLHLGDAGADAAEDFARDLPFVGGEQDQIAFFDEQF